ncbi:hypothetical protein [Streptomyces gilvosporeus]|uniref:Uncharacterized protein n=1 Tax=Streptomyces gilvosporeus TaxID=553510 RepID=A0A1V0TSW4_9ACTN|nr:hypothetical protein [Streptomyces gilvosporeus]ARF56049.1 hypothetical protein B1H19_19295 [Streptomyces gilvosporeus]
MGYTGAFEYAWDDASLSADRPSVLSVVYEREATGRRRWLLRACHPLFTEILPFHNAAHVRQFAQAMLDLPDTAEYYDVELDFSEADTGAPGPEETKRICVATVSVFRDPADGLRPGLNYQSFYEFSGQLHATGLGMQICCDDVDIDRLRAEATALLAALGDDG